MKRSALIFSLSLCLAVAMSEAGLRVAGSFRPDAYRTNALPLWEPTTDHRPFALRALFSYRLTTPDFDMRIQTNEDGLREEAHGLLPAVLVMGDSHTFGYGVNVGERYSDLLKPLGGVVNVGYANGFSPVDYAGYLPAAYPAYRPRVVIVGMFPENDIVNDTQTRHIDRDAHGDIIGTRLNGFRVVNHYLTSDAGQASPTAARVKNALWDALAVYRLAEAARTAIRYRMAPTQAASLLPGFFVGEHGYQHEIAITLGALEQMNRFLTGQGSRLIVYLIPSNFQIHAHYDQAIMGRPGYQVSADWMALAKRTGEPHGYISRWLEARGIAVINPIAAFRAAEQEGQRLYFPYDGHLNRAGHALSARLIEAALP